MSFRKRPCAMYKDNAVGNVVEALRQAETVGLRHDWAIFQCRFRFVDRRWKARFDAHLNSLQGNRRQPIMERQICATCLFAESFGLCLCFLPSCAMYKDNVVAETGRDLVFMTTAWRSDLSMPLKGEVRRSTWTVCTAGDSELAIGCREERQTCTTCLSRRALDCEKTTVLHAYAFSHRGAHLCLRGDLGKRGDLTWQPAVKHQNPPAKTTNSNSCDHAVAQVKVHKPAQPGWKHSKYWANLEKRNQINIKNYWK